VQVLWQNIRFPKELLWQTDEKNQLMEVKKDEKDEKD